MSFHLTMSLPHSTKSRSLTLTQDGHRTVAQQAADAVREFAARRGVAAHAVEWRVMPVRERVA